MCLLYGMVFLPTVKEINRKKTRAIEQLRKSHYCDHFSIHPYTCVWNTDYISSTLRVIQYNKYLLHQVYVRAFALALAFQMVFWDGEDSNLKNQLHYILASEPWKEII